MGTGLSGEAAWAWGWQSTGALTLATFHYKVKDAVDFAISPLWLQFLSPGVAVFFKNSSS